MNFEGPPHHRFSRTRNRRQGIGRSGLLAAALLVSSSVDPDAAIRRVSDARGLPVPETAQQKEWITKFAEDFVDTLAQG